MIQDMDVELKKLDFECKRPQIVETGAGPCATNGKAEGMHCCPPI